MKSDSDIMKEEIMFYENIKKSLETQICHIETTVENINNILHFAIYIEKDNCDILNSYLSFVNYPYAYGTGTNNNKLIEIKELKNTVQQKIYSLCQHEYIDDVVELKNETMLQIRYCQHCYHDPNQTTNK